MFLEVSQINNFIIKDIGRMFINTQNTFGKYVFQKYTIVPLKLYTLYNKRSY